MKKVSTSALSKAHAIDSKKLFKYLEDKGLITTDRQLTQQGIDAGGEHKESSKYGKYIVWPETIEIELSSESQKKELITSSVIGEHFELSARKINFILSEIGWVKNDIKGWLITEQGEQQGGTQERHHQSGKSYTKWPHSLLNSKILNDSIAHVKGTHSEQNSNSSSNKQDDKPDFREKFEAKHRSTDGHFVRSKAEMLIDNWLYMAEIVHAYERKLPVEEDVYSDFYIPTGKVYIEYWGYENDEKYIARKKKKLEIYEKYGFNLIQLVDKDVQNLDDVLPRMLLEYGVQAY